MAGLQLQGFKPFAMVWGRGGSRWTSLESAHPGKKPVLILSCFRKGLWDASLQIKPLSSSIYISSFNSNRFSYPLSSSINVCLGSSHSPHFFTVPKWLEDQTCPLTLDIAIGWIIEVSWVIKSLYPSLFFHSILFKKKPFFWDCFQTFLEQFSLSTTLPSLKMWTLKF